MNLQTKWMLTALLCCFLNAAQAQTPVPVTPAMWFTVMGDPDDASVNTVQVDPLDHEGMARTKRVRVSRSTPRTSWDGVPYRSYVSIVSFDCEKNKARYLKITYYDEASWHGEPAKSVDYTKGPPRWMEFRDVLPNPTQRIINAACTLSAGVKTTR